MKVRIKELERQLKELKEEFEESQNDWERLDYRGNSTHFFIYKQ